MLRSREFLADEEAARKADEEWAKDNERPAANLIDMEWMEQEALVSPWVCATIDLPIPKSYRQAMNTPNVWFPAMKKEIDQLESKEVWKLVDLPQGEPLLEGMWVYNHK